MGYFRCSGVGSSRVVPSMLAIAPISVRIPVAVTIAVDCLQ